MNTISGSAEYIRDEMWSHTHKYKKYKSEV